MSRLVITVHGIRTFGHWQRRLEELIHASAPDEETQVDSIDYGYFSVVAFFLPFVRWLATRRIRKLLLRSVTARPWSRIDIVAHSFGTHLVGWALRGLTIDERKQFQIHTVIFAGSVLHPRFRWEQLLDDRTGCVNRVVNDCGTKDKILLLSQMVVPLASMAGRVGFRGVMNKRFRNRFFSIGHSGYFLSTDGPSDFMKRWWLPLLTTKKPIESHDERSSSTTAGFATFLINNAEPAKLFAYTVAAYFLIYSPIHNMWTEKEKAQRTELVAHLADIAASADTEAEDVSKPALLARQAYLFNERFQTHRTTLVDRALRKVLNTRFASVKLWESPTEMTAADFSQDGRWLAVANHDSRIVLWELEVVSAPPTVLEHSGGVIRALRFQPDSKGLVAVTDLSEVLIWDLTKPDHPHRRFAISQRDGNTGVFAFSDNAGWLATGLERGKISIWKLDELERAPIELCCHSRAVTAVAFNPLVPTILASGGFDKTVRLWDVTQPDLQIEVDGLRSAASAVAWHPDGRLLAVGTKASLGYPSVEVSGAEVLMGDVFGKPHSFEVVGHHDAAVSALEFSPDGQTLASAGSGDRTIALWPTAAPDAAPTRLQKHRAAVSQLLFDPRGRYLLSIDVGDYGVERPTARLWYLDKPPGAARVLNYHKGAVKGLSFDPSGRFLASVGGIDATLNVYDVQENRLVVQYDHGEADAESVRFSPDGQSIATGSKSSALADAMDFRVRLWNVDPQERSQPLILDGHKSAVLALAFSTNGDWLASSGHLDREIRLWDLKTHGREPAIIALDRDQVLTMAFRPGMSTLVWAGTDGSVYVKDVADHDAAPQVVGIHEQPVTALAFTPDGEQLFSGGGPTIKAWDPDSAQAPPMTVLSQGAGVTALSVDGSGRMLASAGEDGRVRMWDIASIDMSVEQQPLVLDGPGNNVLSVALSADGHWLAAGGSNGEIAVWPTVSLLAERACTIARRNLTDVEWRAAVGDEYDLECVCSEFAGCPANR